MCHKDMRIGEQLGTREWSHRCNVKEGIIVFDISKASMCPYCGVMPDTKEIKTE